MSTRATIGLKRPDGTITAIICWYNGYPGHTGRILKKYYAAAGKIEELLKGGNLELIQPTIKRCEFQYRGDDGVPDDCKAATLRSVDAFTHQVRDFGQDYGYLFQDGGWYYCRPGEQLTPMPQ